MDSKVKEVDVTELEQYYNKFNEEKRLNSRHGKVEFITSMKYIYEYLGQIENTIVIEQDKGMTHDEIRAAKKHRIKILDVGAGTGRYSVPLAEDGYDSLRARYVPTAKNSQVKDFYDKCGFTCTVEKEDGSKEYAINLASADMSIKAYYHITIK